jgi:sugar/nucleoside kinase (ribokinase family)
MEYQLSNIEVFFMFVFFRFIFDDFEKHNVDINHAVMHHGVKFPLSSVIINNKNGSRTIIHANMGWPELTLEDLKQLNLQLYSWIHFEVRPLLLFFFFLFKCLKQLSY